ncbi:MAG: Asp-tRNA(Asn)/Glu-tRNA(Gln) amidotransferase subunit GatB [Burkholderiaceae bacterium]|jgi:aspartyl-tRNA(Asn)/glutamyl-tRNA(Gln) amidotransferase subunit B
MLIPQGWELVIGLETHVQLQTRSKIFSGASTAFGAEPNRQACAVDLGLPGVLPVLNREAVALAIRFGLAVGGQIAQRSIFARKNYFYPDLPKGYQISQYEIPVVSGGSIDIGDMRVELTRAHLEEDAGKSLHEDYAGFTGIDLNRAGTPLLEIVSEPQMRSAAQAVAYAKQLHALVVWLGICDGNMQEGSFRVDANVSVRRLGDDKLGTRCEIKNLNSFRFLEQAIQVEALRQIDALQDGVAIIQQTRLYDPDADETRAMRSKEDAHDYRYFPDPDLPPLVIGEALIQAQREAMPELAAAMRARWQQAYSLSDYDLQSLSASRATANYFEAVLAVLHLHADTSKAQHWPKLCANWVLGEVAAACNRHACSIDAAEVSPVLLAALLMRSEDGSISAKTARSLFVSLWDEAAQAKARAHAQTEQSLPASGPDRLAPGPAEAMLDDALLDELNAALKKLDSLIDAQGLRQLNDDAALTAIVDQVLAANPKSVAEFLSGKDKALNALVGQVMKASAGKANPGQVNQLLRARVQP